MPSTIFKYNICIFAPKYGLRHLLFVALVLLHRVDLASSLLEVTIIPRNLPEYFEIGCDVPFWRKSGPFPRTRNLKTLLPNGRPGISDHAATYNSGENLAHFLGLEISKPFYLTEGRERGDSPAIPEHPENQARHEWSQAAPRRGDSRVIPERPIAHKPPLNEATRKQFLSTRKSRRSNNARNPFLSERLGWPGISDNAKIHFRI